MTQGILLQSSMLNPLLMMRRRLFTGFIFFSYIELPPRERKESSTSHSPILSDHLAPMLIAFPPIKYANILLALSLPLIMSSVGWLPPAYS
jgi:hypothetical protein